MFADFSAERRTFDTPSAGCYTRAVLSGSVGQAFFVGFSVVRCLRQRALFCVFGLKVKS
jgi:hypothetical protein